MKPNASIKFLNVNSLCSFRPFSSLQPRNDLHRRAGSKNVFELHGNIERNYCMKCGKNFANEFVLSGEKIPYCECGGLIRPDVVWFGEMLPDDEWSGAMRACQSADVLMTIGTSGVVFPAASLPIEAKRAGAFIAEPTPLTEIADEFLQGNAGEILPLLYEQISSNIFHRT
jgi:NAD-dependent deacetylase